jgi:hypothetical protein
VIGRFIKALVILENAEVALLQAMLVRFRWSGICPDSLYEQLDRISDACERALQAGMSAERCVQLQRWAAEQVETEDQDKTTVVVEQSVNGSESTIPILS